MTVGGAVVGMACHLCSWLRSPVAATVGMPWHRFCPLDSWLRCPAAPVVGSMVGKAGLQLKYLQCSAATATCALVGRDCLWHSWLRNSAAPMAGRFVCVWGGVRLPCPTCGRTVFGSIPVLAKYDHWVLWGGTLLAGDVGSS